MKKKFVGGGAINTGALALDSVAFAGLPVASTVVSSALSICNDVSIYRFDKLLNRMSEYYADSDDEKLQKLLEKIEECDDLKEHFFDVVQSAIRTKSELARTMLAIAFCKIQNNSDSDNKIEIAVCESFQDITDDELLFFKEVVDENKLNEYEENYSGMVAKDISKISKEKNGYYSVSMRSIRGSKDGLLSNFLNEFFDSEIFTYINSLQYRKMLLPIQIPLPDEFGYVSFGVGDSSFKFRDLLIEAEELINKDKK